MQPHLVQRVCAFHVKYKCMFPNHFPYFDTNNSGVPMVPISWTEMQCPNTLVKEQRKVAKIVPESAVQEAANNKISD